MDPIRFGYDALHAGDELTSMQTFAALCATRPLVRRRRVTRWSLEAEAEQLDALEVDWARDLAAALRQWICVERIDDTPTEREIPASIRQAYPHNGSRTRPLARREHAAIWSAQAQVQQVAERVWLIDEVLTEEAMDDLRQFFSGSTIWRSPYAGRYAGAFLEDGLASEGLADLVSALRSRAPGVGCEDRVKQVWAFRCEPSSGGLAPHADRSDLNINLWTTPTEMCTSVSEAGLVIWPIRPPADVPFATVNGDTAWCRSFIEASGVEPLRIDYRANRMVVFDAGQFHASAGADFHGGADGRRINLTVLLSARSRGR